MNQPSHAFYSELCDGLSAMQVDLSHADSLLQYLDLLAHWNKTYNLTAIREQREMLVKHLFDSLAMHMFVTQENLADLGTGPGLPGIPLAIVKPNLSVSLVESNGKKTRFMREVLRQVNIQNAEVIESRAEAVTKPGQYQAITARAMDRLTGILKVGGHLLAPNGVLLAMKGPQIQDEIDELPAHWQVQAIHSLCVPQLNAERQLLIIARKPANC